MLRKRGAGCCHPGKTEPTYAGSGRTQLRRFSMVKNPSEVRAYDNSGTDCENLGAAGEFGESEGVRAGQPHLSAEHR
jgi:hypothetical protein